jgi:Ca2+-binding RTX toxin-like protein
VIARLYGLAITNMNEAPNSLALSSSSFDENISMDSLIATLSATDPDLPLTPQTFTYSLTPGYGDNLIFYVSGHGLHITGSPTYADYERQSSFSIRLQVSDQGGLSFQRDVKLLVNDLPDTPSYSTSQSASSILEGQSVSFGLATTNVAPYTTIYWAISGSGISASDFGDGLLSGSGVLGADGRLSLLRTTVSDALSDPDERFSLSFFADAARTTALSPALTVQINEPRVGSPSDGSDVITGSAAAETISGVPADSTLYGKGSIDRFTGGGGADIFMLGSSSGSYYDGDGTTGLAILSDFSVGLDMVQLNGIASNYILNNGRYNSVNGVFISLASGGDRIGFVEGLRTTGVNFLNLNDPSQFRYV